MQNDTICQAIDEYMDRLSDLPEDEIRRMFSNMRIPHNVDFNWTIGGTGYIVTSHFNQNANDDIFHILIRLMETR